MSEPGDTLPAIPAFDDTGTIYAGEADMDTMGGRMSRAREAAGMTPQQLARRIGVKTATILAWESDRSEPRANRLTTLAGVLNVGLAWLIHGIGDAPATSSEEDFARTVSGHLARMKRLHDETGAVIKRLEAEIARFNRMI
ncbi:multiprotein-bridging factor 1 family protein [Zhengella sp. ZM62]|uniref:helix-turn-helix domain-containing protein n=1 Tax=Zhengella sedimenti TaxID=3390035 RepID=UPI00397722F1